MSKGDGEVVIRGPNDGGRGVGRLINEGRDVRVDDCERFGEGSGFVEVALSNEVSDAVSGAVFCLGCLGGVFLMGSDVGELKSRMLGENVVKKGSSFGIIAGVGG